MPDKTKILMIDDEADFLLMVKDNLEDTGEFEVITTSEPTEAVTLAQQERPGLIMLDVVMPGIKGDGVVKALKKNEETKKIPVIIVSGKGEMVYDKKKHDYRWLPNTSVVQDRGDIPEARGAEALSQAYGSDDYIAKPFSTDQLLEVIRDVLKRTRKKSPEEDDTQLGV